jgi:multiple sugar transport system permease protein
MTRYSRTQTVVFLAIVLVGTFITLFPLWWLLVSSFTPEKVIFVQSGLWPTQFTLQNYITGWAGGTRITFGTYFVNSFLVVGLRVIGTVISSAMTGFAFARLEFAGKKIFFSIMLLLMMLPFHVTLIPRYILFYKIGWIDSYKPLIVPAFLATQGFFIFLFVQFIRGLPREIDQAATVDGCSPIDIFWRIVMPLTLPAVVTASIFTFIWSWNDFFSNLIYISNPKKFTVALGLRAFVDSSSGAAFGALFAMSVLSLIPIVFFFIAAQRLLIEGISTTGLKG